MLRCVETPPVGGDTIWVNMAEAYRRLPEHVKERIAGLRSRHSIEASFGAAMPDEQRRALHARFPDAEHAVVRTHPETGEEVPASPTWVEEHLRRLVAHGIQPHFQLANSAQLETEERLVRRGVYTGPLNITWVAVGGGFDGPNPYTMTSSGGCPTARR